MGIGTVFSDETEEHLRRMQTLIQAVQYALPVSTESGGMPGRSSAAPPSASAVRTDDEGNVLPLYDSASAQLHVSNDPNGVINALREVGDDLMVSLGAVRQSMEDHFVAYFNHLRRRHEDELALWMPTSGAVTQADAPQTKLGGGTNQGAATLLRTKAPNPSVGAAVDALNAWMTLQLEGVMTSTGATKGAVYVKSQDGTNFLRPVALLPPEGNDLPRDTAMLSGSTLGTVVMTSVGINITNTKDDLIAQEGAPHRVSAPPLKVRSALVFPIPLGPGQSGGAVIIADKRSGPAFEAIDEHALWGFTNIAEAIFRRYPVSGFLNYKPSADILSPLKSYGQVPPVNERPREKEVRLSNGTTMPQKSPKALIIRKGTSADSLLAKDASAPSHHLRDEEVIETVAPFVRNLEQMWRRSLDTITTLRHDCERWEDTVSAKDNKIVDLEILVRHLNKQIHRMKMDIQQLKTAAPEHLHAKFSRPEYGSPNISQKQAELLGSTTDSSHRMIADKKSASLSNTVETAPNPPNAVGSSEDQSLLVPLSEAQLAVLNGDKGRPHVVDASHLASTVLSRSGTLNKSGGATSSGQGQRGGCGEAKPAPPAATAGGGSTRASTRGGGGGGNAPATCVNEAKLRTSTPRNAGTSEQLSSSAIPKLPLVPKRRKEEQLQQPNPKTARR